MASVVAGNLADAASLPLWLLEPFIPVGILSHSLHIGQLEAAVDELLTGSPITVRLWALLGILGSFSPVDELDFKRPVSGPQYGIQFLGPTVPSWLVS